MGQNNTTFAILTLLHTKEYFQLLAILNIYVIIPVLLVQCWDQHLFPTCVQKTPDLWELTRLGIIYLLSVPKFFEKLLFFSS